MAQKSRSKNAGNKYSQYKIEQRWSKNRKKKLARHLKKFPNDTVAQLATSNIVYRRKKPLAQVWSQSDRATATLLKTVEGVFSLKEHQKKERVVFNKISDGGAKLTKPSVNPPGWFSIRSRLEGKAV